MGTKRSYTITGTDKRASSVADACRIGYCGSAAMDNGLCPHHGGTNKKRKEKA